MSRARKFLLWLCWSISLGGWFGLPSRAQAPAKLALPARPAMPARPAGPPPLFALLKREPAGPATVGPVQADGEAPGRTLPWVVYSDRDDNPTYRHPTLGPQFQKLRFREAFYVLGEHKGFLHLVRYSPALNVGTVYAARLLRSRKEAVCVGWVPKDQLLLSGRATRDSAGALPTLYCPALASSQVLRNAPHFLYQDSLRLFGQPELTAPRRTYLKLYDLAYVYKFTGDGRAALLGSASWLPADSAAAGLLGWVPTAALQPVGQGLFLEADTAHTPGGPPPVYDTPALARQTRPNDSAAHPRPPGPDLPEFPAVPWAGSGPRYPVLQACTRGTGAPVWQLGELAPLLESNNFVLNVDGDRITRPQAAGWRARGRIYNLVYVLEDSPAMRPFWGDLVNAVQATVSQLNNPARPGEYRVGLVLYHQAVETVKGTARLHLHISTQPLTRDMGRVIDLLSQRKPPAGTSGFGNQPLATGVQRALGLLQNHVAENNLVVLVGLTGDGRPVLQPAMRTDLRAAEARLLSFQVAAPPDTLANNFVLQSRELVLQAALEGAQAKRARLASTALVVAPPAYDLQLGAQNVYRLAFPKQSMVPGWVLFPAKKTRLPLSLLVATTDSLLAQQRFDARQVQTALDQGFAAILPLRSRLNPQVNLTLEARAERPVPTLRPDLFALRAYPFYRQVYTQLIPPDRSFRQLRLVTADTYAALGQWLALLAADDLDPTRRLDRHLLALHFRQLARYAGRAPADSTTLAQALSLLLGLPARHPLLRQLRLRQLIMPGRLPVGTWAELLYLMRERRDFFARVPTFPNGRFTSNGYPYYWLSEDLFR